jgi:hypothetical protein
VPDGELQRQGIPAPQIAVWRDLPEFKLARFPLIERAYARRSREEMLCFIPCGLLLLAFILTTGSGLGIEAQALHALLMFGGLATPFGLGKLVEYRFKRAIGEAVLDAPACAEGVEFIVQLRFVAAGTTYGRDTGVASFKDGSLVFEGNRTSFTLRAQDVELFHGPKTGQATVEPRLFGSEVRIEFSSPRPRELYEALSAWGQGGQHAPGRPGSPPLTFLPEGETSPLTIAAAAVALGFLPAVVFGSITKVLVSVIVPLIGGVTTAVLFVGWIFLRRRVARATLESAHGKFESLSRSEYLRHEVLTPAPFSPPVDQETRA